VLRMAHMVGEVGVGEVRMVVEVQVCKVEGKGAGMVDERALKMMEDMAVVVEDSLVCKVLQIQACMVKDVLVCKARKLEGMVHNNRHHNGWNSLSTRVPRHPKKATRLIFPVVFSLKDSLC
jgi:hypothetical protein